jgi:hypothetical protein
MNKIYLMEWREDQDDQNPSSPLSEDEVMNDSPV